MMHINKNYIIQRSLEDSKEIFSDLKKFGQYHPLIKSVELLNSATRKLAEFKITERPFNWMPINIQYNAQVLSGEDLIEYKISGVPLLKPALKYMLEPKDEMLTKINFDLKIKGFPIANRILMFKMVKAQDALVKAINNSSPSRL